MNYCLCVSGELGIICLKDLLKQNNSPDICSILTDKQSSINILPIAEQNNIPLFIGNPRNQKAKNFIEENSINIDVILSVNYLFILENDFIELANHHAINLHGSLLPKYRGRTPHVWAIINGEKYTGITAHYMTPLCDEGDIISQVKFEIETEDTGTIVLKKFQNYYPILIKDIISKIENRNIHAIPQNEEFATYYGKRTAADGLINWNWHKERIRDWVRAQAFPYPGAFGFIDDSKIIINKVKYSEYGFNYSEPNGLILAVKENPIVKTPNGAVEILEYIFEGEIREGKIIK